MYGRVFGVDEFSQSTNQSKFYYSVGQRNVTEYIQER